MDQFCKKLTFITTLLLTSYLSLSFAQAPDTLWTKTYGGTGFDWGCAVKQTTDGGYILVGDYGYANAYIIKTDSLGDTLWSKKFGSGAGFWKFYDVVQTADGGYACIGVAPIWHELDLWFVKTDSLGDTLWTRVYEWWWYDYGYSLQLTHDGGYILLGEAEFGSGGPTHAWLLRTDSLGICEYDQTLSSNRGVEVQQTNDGGYIIAGDNTLQGGYIAKTDSFCNIEWEKWYGDDQVGIQSVCPILNGGYMAVGFAPSDSCIWLLRLDGMGDTLWTRKYKQDSVWAWYQPYETSKMTIRQGMGNGYIISTSIRYQYSNNSDIYILKINHQGDIIWERILGGSGFDIAHSIELTTDSGYIVIGSTESFGAGYSDIWLLKLETDTLGMQENNGELNPPYDRSATIFSGPLVLPKGKNCRVFDITGRVVMPDRIKSGIYFVEIDGKIAQKVIKVR